jgi:hypothetical protein
LSCINVTNCVQHINTISCKTQRTKTFKKVSRIMSKHKRWEVLQRAVVKVQFHQSLTKLSLVVWKRKRKRKKKRDFFQFPRMN